MTPGDFTRIPELRKLMAHELIEWENAHEQATNTTIRLTGMPHGSGSAGSMVESAIIRGEMHYERYCSYCDELHDIYARMHKEFIKLNELQRDVIDMLFPQNLTVGKVAKAKNLSERQVFRIKKEAMDLLCTDFLD